MIKNYNPKHDRYKKYRSIALQTIKMCLYLLVLAATATNVYHLRNAVESGDPTMAIVSVMGILGLGMALISQIHSGRFNEQEKKLNIILSQSIDQVELTEEKLEHLAHMLHDMHHGQMVTIETKGGKKVIFKIKNEASKESAQV